MEIGPLPQRAREYVMDIVDTLVPTPATPQPKVTGQGLTSIAQDPYEQLQDNSINYFLFTKNVYYEGYIHGEAKQRLWKQWTVFTPKCSN